MKINTEFSKYLYECSDCRSCFLLMSLEEIESNIISGYDVEIKDQNYFGYCPFCAGDNCYPYN